MADVDVMGGSKKRRLQYGCGGDYGTNNAVTATDRIPESRQLPEVIWREDPVSSIYQATEKLQAGELLALEEE